MNNMVKTKKKGKKIDLSISVVNIFFIIFSLTFILPFIYVISVSFSSESSINQFGYMLWPKEFDLTAYRYVFNNPKQLIDSYKITIFSTVVGTLLSLLVMSLVAYPLSRQNYRYRSQVTFYIFFTMLFSGGLIPSYILNTQYLGLSNNIWVYIFPGLANAFNIVVIRTFFQQLPVSLVESAKIDGASELRIFFQIITPLSKPVLSTIGLFCVLGKWNDWSTSLIYVRDPELFTLQFLLQRILRDAEFINNMINNMPGMRVSDLSSNLPTEGMRFAMCIISAGPMLVVFPFFQKYFTRGLTVGAVKG